MSRTSQSGALHGRRPSRLPVGVLALAPALIIIALLVFPATVGK
jgi:hypothetical protein